MNKTSKKEDFKLPQEVVTVKMIDKPFGSVHDPKHGNYRLFGDAAQEFGLPISSNNGKVICPLNDVERAYMEDTAKSGLSFKPGELSPYNEKGEDYWTNWKVRLDKRGLRFDLSDPLDFITYKSLLTNKELVASSVYEQKDRTSYRWVIEKASDVEEIQLSDTDINLRCWKELDKVKSSPDKMRDILTYLGKRVTSLDNVKTMLSKFNTLFKTDKGKRDFIKAIEDEMFPIRILIHKSVKKGFVILRSGKYYTESNESLSFTGDVPNLENTCLYLNSHEGQDHYIALKSKLEAAMKTTKKTK